MADSRLNTLCAIFMTNICSATCWECEAAPVIGCVHCGCTYYCVSLTYSRCIGLKLFTRVTTVLHLTLAIHLNAPISNNGA